MTLPGDRMPIYRYEKNKDYSIGLGNDSLCAQC